MTALSIGGAAVPFTRRPESASVDITDSTLTTDEIDIGNYSAMMLHFPTGWVACTIYYYAKNPATNDWNELNTADGVPLTQYVAEEQSYHAPDHIFAAHAIKIISSEAGNNGRGVGLTLKS